MAADIGWKTVELQIEALIPGVLIIWEMHALAISWFCYRVTTEPFMPTSEFVRGTLFVAAAYSVGVVSSLVSRVIVDTVSERGPRAVVFCLCAHQALQQVIYDCQVNDPRFHEDYRHEKEKRKWLRKWPAVASWNAVYRSALRRTTRRDEVNRRRSQGRFVRNLLLPAVGAPLILPEQPWSVLSTIVGILFLVFVFLYAYAEYVNFAEAYDISQARSR